MSEWSSEWYTVLKNEFGHLEVEIDCNGVHYVHLQLYKWSKDLFKKYLVLFYAWLNELNKKGVKWVFVKIPEGDSKLYKFEQMFGFEEINRHKGYILMAQKTGE